MIVVEVKPRSDNRYDIHVAIAVDNGEPLFKSTRCYEDVEDAAAVVRRTFGGQLQTVALRITYHNGKTKTEQIR